LQAAGGITYTAIPQKTGGLLAGSFTSDAALLHCQGGSGGSMTLSGSFQIQVPQSP
jgi:hypothetical protein